jgi:hypothetical protein
LLIHAGADVNRDDGITGMNPLIYAIENANPEVVRILSEAAEININYDPTASAGQRPYTPLMMARDKLRFNPPGDNRRMGRLQEIVDILVNINSQEGGNKKRKTRKTRKTRKNKKTTKRRRR